MVELLRNSYTNDRDLTDTNFAQTKRTQILNETGDRVQRNLENTLREFNGKLKEDLESNCYFSQHFTKVLDESKKDSIHYFPLVNEKDFIRAKREMVLM